MPTDTAVTVKEPTPAQKRTEVIRAAMIERLPAILPNGMSPERFEAVTLQALAKDPKLADADPTSIVLAVLEGAQLGLEPTGSLSRAWLVPFKDKDSGKKLVQLMIGYQGYADLARRSGEVSKLWTRVVYEGDTFEVEYGTTDRIIHKPTFETVDPTKITHFYACALLKDGSVMFDVMTKEQVDAIRARSRSANSGPWITDYAEMGRKTVSRRLVKSLPLTVEAMDAIERDDDREFGLPAVTEGPSRAAEVRQLVAERTPQRRQPVKNGPGAPEEPEAPPESTPEPDVAPEAAACGDRLVPVEGDVQVCELPAGHEGQHAKGSARWKRA